MAGYGDDTAFAAWMTDNGYTLPVTAPAPAVLRNRGSQYIDAVYGDRFIGLIAAFDQERQWPRTGASLRGVAIPSDVVPKAVVNASFYAAYQEATDPGSLSATGSATTAVTREKIGQIEVQYASATSESTGEALTPLISIVDGMLAPYLRDPNAPCFGIWSIGGRC